MKSFSCKASNDIVPSSTRDRNDAAVVMQINFTLLKSVINASQRNNASQCLKKNTISDIVYSFMTLVHNLGHDMMN